MSSVDAYKCPSCGAPISFKPALGKFKCDYCTAEYTEEELTAYLEEQKNKSGGSEKSKEKSSAEGYQSYHCNSCGAEVVTDAETTATFCYYCHSPVILSGKMEGDFKPNRLIPFKIDRARAEKMFLDWVGSKRFVPSDFGSKKHVEKMTGIYVPHWSADIKGYVRYKGLGKVISTWTSGDTEYTKTKEYDVRREGSVHVNNINEVATSRLNNVLMNGISPYDDGEEVDFSKGYLSGFFAESYNIEKEQVMPTIQSRAKEYTDHLVSDTLDYTSLSQEHTDFDIRSADWLYTLYPAWILTYNYHGKIYIFAINGSTGKSFGELPVDGGKLARYVLVLFAIIAVILLAGGRFLW